MYTLLFGNYNMTIIWYIHILHIYRSSTATTGTICATVRICWPYGIYFPNCSLANKWSLSCGNRLLCGGSHYSIAVVWLCGKLTDSIIRNSRVTCSSLNAALIIKMNFMSTKKCAETIRHVKVTFLFKMICIHM